MARQLGFYGHSSDAFQIGGLSVFLCAVALLMCASHSRKWRQWRACYEPDTDDTIHHMSVIHHIQHGTDDHQASDMDGPDVPVWQKNILMGGKCELPDFSGVIIYDSNGGLVTPAKTPRLLLPWK